MSDNFIEKLRQQARLSKLDKENAKLKRLLAEACLTSTFSQRIIWSPQLQKWYAEHKKFDEERNNNRKHDLDGK